MESFDMATFYGLERRWGMLGGEQILKSVVQEAWCGGRGEGMEKAIQVAVGGNLNGLD